MAAGLKEANPVQKISIISRGMAGGYTIELPIEDRHLKTRSEFMAEIAVALGGYVSELINFNDVTTGSSNDIEQSTKLIRNLITRYGMSEKLGPRTFGKTEEMIFLGKEISTEKDYSEKMAEEIDREVNWFVKKGEQTAKKIITKNKKLLDEIANTLIKRETIEREEFDKLIKKFKLKPISVTA